VERFGPVRTVKPELVFELGFEGIQRSSRHKSGIAVRFPAHAAHAHGQGDREANTVEDALALAGIRGAPAATAG
jgi:DNA ligase-1